MTDIVNVTGAVTPEFLAALNENFQQIDQKLDTLDELSPGHSTSSVAIGIGAKTFTVDKEFAVGSWVTAASDADPAGQQMTGRVLSYADGVLEVDVQTTIGDGTYADWTIRVSGAPGDTGPQGAPGTSRLINVRVASTVAVLPADVVAGYEIDDVELSSGDIWMRRIGSNSTINGIYVVQPSGGSVRHADFDAYADHAEVLVAVEEGTRYSRTLWQCTATRTGTLGSTDLIFVERAGVEPILEPRYDIINAGGKILIPSLYWKYRDDQSYALASPSDGSRYWEVDASASPTTITRYYFDLDLIASNPIVTATGSAWPVKPSWRRAEIGHSINGVFHSKFSVAGQPGAAGIGKNIFAEGNDPDHAPVRSGGASVVDVVDTTLNAMGITRGVMRTTSFSAYGFSTPRTRGADWIAARYYVKADNDSPSWDFEDHGAWGYRYGNRTVLTTAAPQLEKIYSASLRSYVVFGKIEHDFTRFMIGIQKKVGDTTNYIVAGEQFAMSRNGPIGWINRDDYNNLSLGLERPAVPAPIHGGELFLIEGRQKTLFLENIVPLRDERDFFGALELDTTADDAAQAVEYSSARRIDLDVALFPLGTSTAYLRIWPDRQPQDSRFELPLTVHKVAGDGPATSTSSVSVGTGEKVFTTQSGRDYTVGRWVLMESDANPANWMRGQVTSYIGTALTVDVQTVGGSGTFADWTIWKNPKVLIIGDSIPNRRLLQLIDARLRAIGVKVVWIGSVATSDIDSSPSNATGLFGECREGRGLGGMLACTTNCVVSTPLTDDKVAEYVAGDGVLTVKMTRVGYNPFLRPKAGDGSEDDIAQDGWVFDFEGAYIDRLSPYIATVEMPDITIVLKGTNDWTDDGPAFILPNFQFAVPRVLDSLLSAKSDMLIGFGMEGFAESAYVTDTQQKLSSMLAELVGQVNTYKEAEPAAAISMISAWAHMTPYSGWTLDESVAVDAATGLRWVETSDKRHPVGPPRQQLADDCAAYLANVA